MSRRVAVLFAPLLALGVLAFSSGGGGLARATDTEPPSLLTSALVSSNSSRCVAVPGASEGDVAVVNITNTQARGGGWGALRSSDATPVYDRPTADQYSSVNFAADTPANPNLAISEVGSDGEICYDNGVSATNVILDLAAIIPAANIDTFDPDRVLDTRSDTEPVAADSSRCVEVPTAVEGDVVVVNITNTQAQGLGWGALASSDVTPVYERPPADQYSSVNFAAGTPANPNLALATIGSDNEFCYDNGVSASDVILDLAAIIPAADIDAIEPERLLDSRTETTQVEIVIADFAFVGAQQVPVGGRVVVTNTDSAMHTWTAVDGSFDSGTLAEGESFEFTFDEPGTFEYRCDLHPSMTGTITVTG